jgi:hypothetical protein
VAAAKQQRERGLRAVTVGEQRCRFEADAKGVT